MLTLETGDKIAATLAPQGKPGIPPTIGRIVWYWPCNDAMQHDGHQPCAAQIVYVHSHELVNLAINDADGNHHARTSVRLVQEGEPMPSTTSSYCTWMPYQQQAAKKDIAERKYTDGTTSAGPGQLPDQSPAQTQEAIATIDLVGGGTHGS